MKKRLIYYNREITAEEKDILLSAAHMTGACGLGKISIHLSDGITLEREDGSQEAILTIREMTYKIIVTSSFEMIIGKKSPTIYVLESKGNDWKKGSNRLRLKKVNFTLLGIKDIPCSKQGEKRQKSSNAPPMRREYSSYQLRGYENAYRRNELHLGVSEKITINKKKTMAANDGTEKERKCSGTYILTLIISLISLGTAFYTHSGVSGVEFPYPFLGEYFIDCTISISALFFTWSVVHMSYLVVKDTMVAILKLIIDRKWTANRDRGNIVVIISGILSSFLILLIASTCIYICI